MIKFPFTSMQQFNLDWIMEQLHKILRFMPLNGAAGDVLQRTVDGAAWQPISAVSLDIHNLNTISGLDPADEFAVYDNDQQGNYKATLQDILDEVQVNYPVTSVNGQTGAVVLGKSDVGLGSVDNVQQYSASNPPPYPVTSVNGQTGAVIISGGGAVDSVNGQTGTVVLSKSDIGLGNVDNVQQYSASNPPPYPVTSVNGQTGDVIISGGGLPVTFNTPLSLTISSIPGDVTVASYSLYGEISNDGNYLRIFGNLTTTNATSTTGWKDFTVTGLTITPSVNRQVQNCGIAVTSPTGIDPVPTIRFDQQADLVVKVTTGGEIILRCYYASILDNEVHYFSFMPFIIPIS